MDDTKKHLEALLAYHKIDIRAERQPLLDAFVAHEININLVRTIRDNQKILIMNWKLNTRIEDIVAQAVFVPNGTVNKEYLAKIDFIKLGWNDIVYSEITGLDDTGLAYDSNEELLIGTPKVSGDLKINLLFRIEGEPEDSTLNKKEISIIINPDPKSLWKNIDSDIKDPYWKADEFQASGNFLDKKIVVASKRGRSHANVGSFRDDDFAFKNLDSSDWSVLAVSDGAGSARLSRKGSQLSCDFVVKYFEENFTSAHLQEFDEVLLTHHQKTDVESSKKISRFVYDNLSKAAYSVHKQLAAYALSVGAPLKDFHSTLIFAVVKKYEFGYAILTFGVGDCPIGLLNKDLSEIKLMNWLDVGEFGGGTRFITMPEIFQSDKFSTRFGFKLIDDFSYLMLMTDGIYDPKFVVEANLEKIDCWKAFLEDLKGKNDDGIGVELHHSNAEVATQLSSWMNFWNPGNHDDRTLAIIY